MRLCPLFVGSAVNRLLLNFKILYYFNTYLQVTPPWGMGMGTGIAKNTCGLSLQIIIHAVNQSRAVYDPNAEPTSGHGT